MAGENVVQPASTPTQPKRVRKVKPLPNPIAIIMQSMTEEDGKVKEECKEKCNECVQYYPEGDKDGWGCLSGHDGLEHPCSDYEAAIFLLVRGFEYTPEQTFRLRAIERDMKKKLTGE